MEYNVAISSVVRPLLRLVFIGGAVLLGFSLYGAVAGMVVAGGLTFVIAMAVLLKRTSLAGIESPTRAEAIEYYNFSVPLTFSQLGNFLYNRIDILMIGYFLASSDVGVYNISVMLAGLLVLPLQAFNQMFPPIASKLYHDDEREQLDSVYTTITRWTFSLSLFPAIITVAFSTEILGFFGPEFTRGQLILILFVFAQLTNAAVGPSGFLLMMTDHQYLTLLNHLSSGVLNAVLNVVLILEFGFVGAAMATASVLVGINILRIIEVWYFEGLFPYSLSYYKPIVAGILSSLAIYLLTIPLNGFPLLVSGALLGGVVFLGILYLLGIEESERKMFEDLISRMT
jgi:O-antigen/teichoic acid export membrane protein